MGNKYYRFGRDKFYNNIGNSLIVSALTLVANKYLSVQVAQNTNGV